MKNPLKYGVIGLLASTMLLAPRAVEGQPGGKGPQPQMQPSAQEREAQYGPTVSVDFKGGTLEAYVQALQKAVAGKSANVVVPAAAKKVDLPPIELRDVSMYTALSAITSAFEVNSEHEFGVRTIGIGGDAAFAIQYARLDRSSAFTSARQPQPGMVQVPTRRLEVYSIRDLIEPPAGADGSPQAKVAYESILSAVDAAMGMFDEKEPPKLMFHKETGLLLVGGTPYQTEVVDNLIRRIRDDLQRRWSEERGAKKQSAEQQRKVALARTELQIAQKELELSEEQAGMLKQLVDQGATPRGELNEALMNVDRKKAVVERRRIELDAASDDRPGDGGATTSLQQYDVADVVAANPETVTLVEMVAQNGGGKATVQAANNGKPARIVVEGNERTHALVKKLLENIRKHGK